MSSTQQTMRTNIVKVNATKKYEIINTKGTLCSFGKQLKTLKMSCKAMIVADSTTAMLYLDTVSESLLDEGFDVFSFVFQSGEEFKSDITYLSIVSALADNQFTKTDVVVALGGGVVGDVAGFASATYMRGVDYVQVPTTLLSAIDSSVGGKTAINMKNGKNMLGVIVQPILVYFDIDTLKTLSDIEWQNGMGEGIKYACLAGGEIADLVKGGLKKPVFAESECCECDKIGTSDSENCEQNEENESKNSKQNEENDIENCDECNGTNVTKSEQDLLRFVALCQQFKADVVEQDEFETGLRKTLNLGHTIGHAVEKLTDFKTKHGDAVLVGMQVMAVLGKAKGILKNSDKVFEILKIEDTEKVIEQSKAFELDKIVDQIKSDKKMKNKNIVLVQMDDLGAIRLEEMTLQEFKADLERAGLFA